MPSMFWLCLEEGKTNPTRAHSFWWEAWANSIPIMQPHVCELVIRACRWALAFPSCVLVFIWASDGPTCPNSVQWAETVPRYQLKPLTHTISILVVNKALIAHLIQPYTLVGALPVHTHLVQGAIVSAVRALIHIYGAHNTLVEEKRHMQRCKHTRNTYTPFPPS